LNPVDDHLLVSRNSAFRKHRGTCSENETYLTVTLACLSVLQTLPAALAGLGVRAVWRLVKEIEDASPRESNHTVCLLTEVAEAPLPPRAPSAPPSSTHLTMVSESEPHRRWLLSALDGSPVHLYSCPYSRKVPSIRVRVRVRARSLFVSI